MLACCITFVFGWGQVVHFKYGDISSSKNTTGEFWVNENLVNVWSFCIWWKGICFRSKVLYGLALCYSWVLFLASLPVNIKFQPHWPPWCSPTCQPCSAPGHLHGSLSCLECSSPFICKAGPTPETQMWILTEDVLFSTTCNLPPSLYPWDISYSSFLYCLLFFFSS